MAQDGYVPGGFGFKQEGVNPSIGRKVVNQLPVNPNDVSTIVSILPKPMDEKKATIFPSRFYIPAAAEDDFNILHVRPSSWYLNQPGAERMPPIEIQVNSYQLAESIVRDYNNSTPFCDMGGKMPGLFCIPGEWTKSDIKNYTERSTGKTFDVILGEAKVKQRAWFAELVQQADKDWARTHGNPLAIPTDARIAALRLKLDKPWISDFKAVSLSPCPNCGELINPIYPICRHCHREIAKVASPFDSVVGTQG